MSLKSIFMKVFILKVHTHNLSADNSKTIDPLSKIANWKLWSEKFSTNFVQNFFSQYFLYKRQAQLKKEWKFYDYNEAKIRNEKFGQVNKELRNDLPENLRSNERRFVRMKNWRKIVGWKVRVGIVGRSNEKKKDNGQDVI